MGAGKKTEEKERSNSPAEIVPSGLPLTKVLIWKAGGGLKRKKAAALHEKGGAKAIFSTCGKDGIAGGNFKLRVSGEGAGALERGSAKRKKEQKEGRVTYVEEDCAM